MAKSEYQKLKLLYMIRVFEQQTDEAHPITVSGLIDQLAVYGISAERKSIYSDIEALEYFGLDIITAKGASGANTYYLGERSFQLPELKLLVDAIQSAKFVTAEKSRELIKKICGLTSVHEAGLVQRQVHLQGRGKTVNTRTYYNVDALHSAIADDVQVTFKYNQWVYDTKEPHLYRYRQRRGGKLYQVSPQALLWDDEYYYLIANDASSGAQRHYRVDHMTDISATVLPRTGQPLSAQALSAYSKSVFGMFGGTSTDLRLRFHKSLIGVALDRFGTDLILFPDGVDHFIFNVQVVVSPQFFSWLLGFADKAQILAPEDVRREIKEQLDATIALYQPIKEDTALSTDSDD